MFLRFRTLFIIKIKGMLLRKKISFKILQKLYNIAGRGLIHFYFCIFEKTML